MRRRACRRPVWCSKVGSRSKPRARWHSVAHWFFRSGLTTVAPNCSLPSFAPTHSRPTVVLCRRNRRLIDTAPVHQGPDDPRHLVRKCHPHQHRRLARQHSGQLRSRSGCGMDVSLDEHAIGPNNQQASQGPLAHLRLGFEPLLAVGRVLLGHDAQPGCKIARMGRLHMLQKSCEKFKS